MGLWCSWRFVSFQDNLVNKEKNKKIKTVAILTLDSRQQRIEYRSETVKRNRKGMEKMEVMFRFLVLLLMNELLLCMVESKGNIHYYDFLVSTNYFSSCFFFFSFILLGMVMGRVQNGIRYPKKLLHLVNNKNVLLLLLFLFLLHFIRNDNGTDLKHDHTRKNFFTLLITRMIFFFFFILLGMTM